ncbi:LytTR family DNA-binding domain-containing protein [Eubacteriales bacterium OttesenSCG-928-N13]|nr:LytTR family DNA-binding domain-containing protein [Eubacteriales bacterium OttesenSCG-928-N13]
MNLIRTLIADDDPDMRMIMKKILSKAGGFELLAEAENGEMLLELYKEHQPQLVIMDVEMPELTGVECARVIQDMNPKTTMIFATAHDKYMGDAFEVYAFDYLLKPFKLDRALRTLSRVKEKLSAPEMDVIPFTSNEQTNHDRLTVKGKEGVHFLDLDKLLLVQREDRSTVLYAEGDQRFVTTETLSELEARLPKDTFFRSHKSYIVNINQIESITPYGRWTYVIRLRGTKRDALITSERFDELMKLFP